MISLFHTKENQGRSRFYVSLLCLFLHINPTNQTPGDPTGQPSQQPTIQPSSQPSQQPSRQPTRQPSQQPTRCPSSQPSIQPSSQPSAQPIMHPTGKFWDQYKRGEKYEGSNEVVDGQLIFATPVTIVFGHDRCDHFGTVFEMKRYQILGCSLFSSFITKLWVIDEGKKNDPRL